MGTYGNEAIEKEAEKAAAEAKKRGRFLSLKQDGDRALLVFLPDLKKPDDAYIYADKIVGFGKKAESYDPQKHQESEGKFRVKWGVYVVKIGSCPKKSDGITADRGDPTKVQWDDVKRMQVLEGGIQLYQVWNSYFKKYGLKWYFEMERHGVKDDTKTTYTFDRTVVIPDTDLRDILRFEYPKLDVAGEDDTEATGGNGASAPQPAADAPITDEVGNDITMHMKSMVNDPASGKAFVKHFGIARIRLLPRSRVPEAMAWVQAMLSVKDKITPTTDVDQTIALIQAALPPAASAGGKDPFAAPPGVTAESDY